MDKDLNQELLNKVLDNVSVIDGGNLRWSGDQHIKYNLYLNILISNILKIDNFELKLKKLRYKFDVSSSYFIDSFLNKFILIP